MKDKKYFLSVGEPWDFESPDGQNIINGLIIRIISATCLIFKSNYVFNLKGVSSNLFVLYPRYPESDFNNLKKSAAYITINGNILPEEYNENKDENYLKENSKFVIIGGIGTK